MDPEGRVSLNIGGTVFQSTWATLLRGGEDSFFVALQRWKKAKGFDLSDVFVDRSGVAFWLVLEYLRGK